MRTYSSPWPKLTRHKFVEFLCLLPFFLQFPIIFLGVTEIQQNLKDDLNSTLGFLDQFLSESKWVAGDNVTIADTSIYASLSSILVSIKLPRNLLDSSLVNLSKPTQ